MVDLEGLFEEPTKGRRDRASIVTVLNSKQLLLDESLNLLLAKIDADMTQPLTQPLTMTPRPLRA